MTLSRNFYPDFESNPTERTSPWKLGIDPSHRFCARHTDSWEHCALPPRDPRVLDADRAAYELVAKAFRGQGGTPPELSDLVAAVSEGLVFVGQTAVDESLSRAIALLDVPGGIARQCRWVVYHETLMLMVPCVSGVGPEDLDWVDPEETDWYRRLTVASPPEGPFLPLFCSWETGDGWGRFVYLHALVERAMALQSAGQEAPNPVAPLIQEWLKKVITLSSRTTRRSIPQIVFQPSWALQGKSVDGGPGSAPAAEGSPALALRPTSRPGIKGKGLQTSPMLEMMELWELGGGGHQGGKPALVSQRVFVAAYVDMPWKARKSEGERFYRLSLKKFLEWIWPANKRMSPSEYLPQIERAAADLDGFRPLFFNPETKRWGRQRLVDFQTLPTGRCKPENDEVAIRVYVPPGSDRGPQVSDRLSYWGSKSTPRWRGLLNLAFIWNQPGRTIVPAKGTGKRRWLRSLHPERYPVLSNLDLVRVFFTTSQNRQPIRKTQLPRALRHVRALQDDGQLIAIGTDDRYQLLPPELGRLFEKEDAQGASLRRMLLFPL